MAKRRGLHHLGEGVKQRRLVRFEVVKINAKSFESNHVEDCFPNIALNYRIVSSVTQKGGFLLTFNVTVFVTLLGQYIDQLFGLSLNNRGEGSKSWSRERF
jgi:hypothetical protein